MCTKRQLFCILDCGHGPLLCMAFSRLRATGWVVMSPHSKGSSARDWCISPAPPQCRQFFPLNHTIIHRDIRHESKNNGCFRDWGWHGALDKRISTMEAEPVLYNKGVCHHRRERYSSHMGRQERRCGISTEIVGLSPQPWHIGHLNVPLDNVFNGEGRYPLS